MTGVTITADSLEAVIAEAAYQYFDRHSTDSDAAHLIDHIYGALGEREAEDEAEKRAAPLFATVERSFNRLRLLGYRCEADWQCCMTCGWEAIPWADADRTVWYHGQDRDRALSHGELTLTWQGDAAEIGDALRAEGLAVEHDGSESTRFRVTLPAKTDEVAA